MALYGKINRYNLSSGQWDSMYQQSKKYTVITFLGTYPEEIQSKSAFLLRWGSAIGQSGQFTENSVK